MLYGNLLKIICNRDESRCLPSPPSADYGPIAGRNQIKTARLAGRAVEDACCSVAFLHIRIVRAAATFRRHPDDVLGWILDIAGFAMHAVLGVDLQTVGAVVGLD